MLGPAVAGSGVHPAQRTSRNGAGIPWRDPTSVRAGRSPAGGSARTTVPWRPERCPARPRPAGANTAPCRASHRRGRARARRLTVRHAEAEPDAGRRHPLGPCAQDTAVASRRPEAVGTHRAGKARAESSPGPRMPHPDRRITPGQAETDAATILSAGGDPLRRYIARMPGPVSDGAADGPGAPPSSGGHRGPGRAVTPIGPSGCPYCRRLDGVVWGREKRMDGGRTPFHRDDRGPRLARPLAAACIRPIPVVGHPSSPIRLHQDGAPGKASDCAAERARVRRTRDGTRPGRRDPTGQKAEGIADAGVRRCEWSGVPEPSRRGRMRRTKPAPRASPRTASTGLESGCPHAGAEGGCRSGFPHTI